MKTNTNAKMTKYDGELCHDDEYTAAEMLARLDVVAIEIADTWVHAVTNDGRYHRHPLASFESADAAADAAESMADDMGVPVVEQTSPSQSIADVMADGEECA